MIRRSWLDSLLESFQHRWETNPQYRAAMSGVLGLIFLVFMCSCVGVVSIGAQSVLTSMGFGGGSGNASALDTNTGTKNVSGASSIPIATVSLGTPQAPPVATLPNTGTPIPTPAPTATPTPTATPVPCTHNCGGGGGNGGTVCPCSASSTGGAGWHRNQTNYLTIHTSAPGIGVSVIINNVPGAGTITQFQRTDQFTDSNGDITLTLHTYDYGDASLGDGTAQATISAGFSPPAFATLNIQCHSS